MIDIDNIAKLQQDTILNIAKHWDVCNTESQAELEMFHIRVKQEVESYIEKLTQELKQ